QHQPGQPHQRPNREHVPAPRRHHRLHRASLRSRPSQCHPVVIVMVTPPLGTPPCQTFMLKWPTSPGSSGASTSSSTSRNASPDKKTKLEGVTVAGQIGALPLKAAFGSKALPILSLNS